MTQALFPTYNMGHTSEKTSGIFCPISDFGYVVQGQRKGKGEGETRAEQK